MYGLECLGAYGGDLHIWLFACLRFYGPVNAVKFMLSESFNLLALFLDWLRPHKPLTTS